MNPTSQADMNGRVIDIIKQSEINAEYETVRSAIIAIVIVMMPFGWDILAFLTCELLIPDGD